MLPQDLLCDQLLSEEFSLEAMEEQLIRTAMDRVEGNVSKAARLLGMTRPQLAYRLKKLDSD
jgi:DNA-binding NtrC family response regulator